MRRLAYAGLAAVCCAPAPLVAGPSTISFETMPDGAVPVDDQPLDHNAWYDAGGVRVRFGFDTDGDLVPDRDAVFEAAGKDGTDAFGNNLLNNARDTAHPGYEARLGGFFLRNDPAFAFEHNFVVEYETPVTRLSGEIWDLDGVEGKDEKWTVLGFDEHGYVAAACVSGRWRQYDAYSFDGLPWRFALDTDRPIKRLLIQFLGSKETNIGFAFNNFDATGAGVPPVLLGVMPGGEDGVVRGVDGVTAATLLWSDGVSVPESAVVVTDAAGDPVQVSVDASDPQRTRVEFERALYADTFTLRVLDTAAASVTGAAIDGDTDGVPGGDAVRTLTHICPGDLTEDGILNMADLSLFIELYRGGCNRPGSIEPDETGDDGGPDEGEPGGGDNGQPGGSGDAGGDGPGDGSGDDGADDQPQPARPVTRPGATLGGGLVNQPRRR